MPKVLIVSHDVVRRQMAGPGIRSYELSRQLFRSDIGVTLAVPGASDIEDSPFPIVPYDDALLRQLVAEHDVVVVQGWVTHLHPFLRESGRRLVVDLYDPLHLENLALVQRLVASEQVEHQLNAVRLLNDQLRDGDYFLCASDAQRDFWLGALGAMGRLNPATYGADPSLRSLIDVVSFGLPEEPPVKARNVMRGVVPGIAADDLILLWGGGIYDWFDPLTLVRGVALAARRHPHLRLVFHAGRHPHPHSAPMAMLDKVRRLSDELGMTGRHAFFNDTWVPYHERADWLLEADVGVSTHRDTVEARLAYRTRVLDYLWAALPVLLTRGDAMADKVEREQLGVVVAPDDAEAIAEAIDVLADEATRRAVATRVREAARALTWKAVAEPLVGYCARPLAAADREPGSARRPVVPVSLLDGETPESLLGISTSPPAHRRSGWLRRRSPA